LGCLVTTYDVHRGLIGKCVVDFLLVLIEVFFARRYGRVAISYIARLTGKPLGATYDNHLRLIGKRIVDFLSALIDPFFAKCYG